MRAVQYTGRSGVILDATYILGIHWTFPAGTKCMEVLGIDNTGPCWLISTSGVTSAMAKDDLRYRYPVTTLGNVEIDP